MAEKVLVAYGSANGSTAQIAEAVARTLRADGLDAQALPAGQVSEVSAYDAVVVGGGLYAGRWQKDARRFVRRHRRSLSGRPVWFFSSGPLDASASERDIPPVPGVRRAMARLDVSEHATFGGRLEEGAKGRMARMIVQQGKGGDFRDFPAIEAWADRIAGQITGRGPDGH